MQLEPRDPAYLWDMLEAAREVQEFTTGVSYEQYLGNRVLQLAVERKLEVIGEAARRVSETVREAHPEIPWQPIISQRNVISHQYGEIKHERIWEVVDVHIPALILMLEPLIPPIPHENP
ncbi:MAG: HepT-like ribonuclease domain-containing protein [Acidobacteriota bacterium]